MATIFSSVKMSQWPGTLNFMTDVVTTLAFLATVTSTASKLIVFVFKSKWMFVSNLKKASRGISGIFPHNYQGKKRQRGGGGKTAAVSFIRSANQS